MKPPLRIVLKSFLNHFEDYEARKKLCDDQYEYEFQQLKKLTDKLRDDPDFVCSCALKDVNRPKNRYKDIVPYDKSRVILPKSDGVPGSDYINASYVKGASGAFAYIAAQGPLPNTVIDFWRMIWICDVQVLVMACNEKEAGKNKCEAYWPLKGEVMHYGNISVELIETSQVCPDFLIRTLLVKCDSEMRDVYQFHYTTWPDHGVPETVHPILELVRLMRDCQATEIMPILVHCSAGCGRTGTICAVDYVWACLRQGKLAEDFSLFQIALELRRQRIAMIQTKEQYILAHKAVATLFEQQLNVIDCHIYVNVDEDGEPLMWKELAKNKLPHFKKENVSSKEASLPTQDVSNDETKEKSTALLEGSTNKPVEIETPLTDSSQRNCVTDILDTQPAADNKLSSKKSISDSLINSSQSSYSRNSYLSQQSNEDSIPFIDDDEVCIRPHCGRAYLNIPSCDSISKLINRFDPFVDKVAVDTDDSSPDADPNAFPQKMLGFQSGSSVCVNRRGDSTNGTKEGIGSEKLDQVGANNYATLPISSSNKNRSHQVVNNRESYPPSTSGLSRFHEESTSDLADESSDSSKQIGKAAVVRRPSISKLKALFEKSGISSFKSSNEGGGKRSLFRHNSHSVSRAGSAPPSLNCMDKTAAVERESILMMVTRKFRSASVRTEREISSKPYDKSRHRKSSPGTIRNFKEGFASLSRTVSFNIGKTFRGNSPAKPKPVEPPLKDTGRVSVAVDIPVSETSKSKLPEVQPKGKSMWYDKSSLPRAVAVVKPTEKTNFQFNANVPKNPSALPSSEKLNFSSVLNKPPKLLPFFSTLNKTNGKDVSTMWYGESEDNVVCTKFISTKKNSDPAIEPAKVPYKSHSNKVLPFIHSISPWKKVNSKSPLSSPDSPKSLVSMDLESNSSISSSKFYTEVENPSKILDIPPALKIDQDVPVCPIPEEIIPLCPSSESSTSDSPFVSLNSSKDYGSGTALSASCETAVQTKQIIDNAVQSETKSVATPKINKDVPPAIPKKTIIGKHKQMLLKDQEIVLETNLTMCANINQPAKAEDPVKPLTERKVESVPPSPKDHYINVNVKAQKNMEQIENTLRNNPRGAIIDLTSRESYCMEDELDNALKRLSKPSDGDKVPASKNTSKFPGYEVIWPETNYPKPESSNNHCKTGLCYSPPLRRSINTMGLTKCRSCSNIDWLEPDANVSLTEISKEPSSSPTKRLVNEAVVELNTLLDQLTTRTLSEEPGFDLKVKQTVDCKSTINDAVMSTSLITRSRRQYEKEKHMTHSVTLVSKSNTSDSSAKEEEIIFHFPPPPTLPPPDDGHISETFNIVRKNGSLVVSEIPKTKESSTCSSSLNDNNEESSDNSVQVPQPTPRKSKQSSGLRRSASYTNVFPPQSKGYENVFLEKYQTLTRLQIDSKDNGPEANTRSSQSRSKQQAGKSSPNYVNVDALCNLDSNAGNTRHSPHRILKLAEADMSNSCPPSAFYVDDSASNKHSTYGKLIKMADKKMPVSEKGRDHQYVNSESGLDDVRKRFVPSKKTERAPLPPDVEHSLQTKGNQSVKIDSQKSGVTKKLPSRKHEKAPLPPPLLQKSPSAIRAAKNLQNSPYYVNFHSRTLVDESHVLPAVQENITNPEVPNSSIGADLGAKKDIKHNNDNFMGQGLSHSQSDASVFLTLKERKSQSLNRGLRVLDPKQQVMNKMCKRNKELVSVSSSDSDSSYERIFFDKPKEQSEKDFTKRTIKEQIILNSARGYRKEMPVAPPRAKRRNTTEIQYAKVKSKEGSPFTIVSSSTQDHPKCSDMPCVSELPPAIPVKTKEAFEIPDGIKGNIQITDGQVNKTGSSFKR